MNRRIERRAARGRRRRRSYGRQIIVVLLAIIVVGSLAIGVKKLSVGDNTRKTAFSKVKPGVNTDTADLKKKTYLVIGIKKDGDKEVATGLLQFVIDSKALSVGGVVIPTNTFVEVAGRGFEPVSDGYGQGIKTMTATVGSFLGVMPRHYIIVQSDTFLSATGESNLSKFFDQNIKTDMSSSELRQGGKDVSAVLAAKVNLIDLPVRPISFGEQTYFDVQKSELDRVVKLFWKIKPVRSVSDNRVIILNGSGLPGVARKAADSLIGKGFKIIDVKNADNFNYERTQILIYNENKAGAAKEVKNLIGPGAIIAKSTPQDVADIVLILGKDFK